MRLSRKIAVASLAGTALVCSAALLAIARLPLDRRILAATQIEYLGEDFPLDGGSRDLFFRLKNGGGMVLQVCHRDPRFGGNPDFQEIWVSADARFKTYIPVAPGSALERKIVSLLGSATCASKPEASLREPPRPEALRWAIERIEDRKTKWGRSPA